MKRVLSGIQPSGNLTIGNYFGAIKSWLAMQEKHECLWMVVDLHALTQKIDKPIRLSNTYNAIAVYLASGLNHQNSTIFLQSDVIEHTYLGWILNCYTQMGEMSRMTQFKDKSKTQNANINLGLYAYPVLQAADILLYQSDIVPVGEDQRQHLELTRDIATRFNNIHGEIFTIPDAYFAKHVSKIMSLSNPLVKMSKSDSNPKSYVYMLEEKNQIAKKFKSAVTDSDDKFRIYYDCQQKPAISNLLSIYSSASGKSIASLEQEYEGLMYGAFKNDVADAVINHLEPIQAEFKRIIKDRDYINMHLKQGQDKARALARETIIKVNSSIGIYQR